MTNRLLRESAEFIAEELIYIVESNINCIPHAEIIEEIIDCLINEGIVDIVDDN